MRQVHDELHEPDGGPGRGASLRPEPRHRGVVQQLVQHQGHAVPAGEWGQEEAWPAGGPHPQRLAPSTYDLRMLDLLAVPPLGVVGRQLFSSRPCGLSL